MLRAVFRFAFIAIWLLPLPAATAPIKLKLAYLSSDRTLLYLASVKPFVDAVNAEANGLVEIEVFFSGVLGKEHARQAELVRDGAADIAYIMPGFAEDRFPDNAVIELPGLFRDQREASLVFTRMIAANALRGYDEFVVITAFTIEPHSIHTRQPIASLADLKGMKIRANSATQGRTLEKLGMQGIVLPLIHIGNAISTGAIDGAAITPAVLTEFGVGRMASYHYMMQANPPSFAVVMNRKTFQALPERAQDIIRKYSGEWSVARANEILENTNAKAIEQLKSDPRRTVIFPSQTDLVQIQATFKSVIDDWVAQDPRNGVLLSMAEAEIAKLRLGQ